MTFCISIIIIEILFLICSLYYVLKKNFINKITYYSFIMCTFIIISLCNYMVINISKSYLNIYQKNNTFNKINDIDKIKENINEIEQAIKIIEHSENNETINEIKKIEEELEKNKLIIEENPNYSNELNNEITLLEEKLDSLLSEIEIVIKPFPVYNQFPNYPNGCESVALHLLLKYNGVDVSVEEIVNKLKKGDRPFKKYGKLYGGDPEIEFVGEPTRKDGYGVYEKPIIDVANYFKSGIKNITGSNFDKVLNIVSKSKPVQVWVSIYLNDTYVCSTWTATSTGRKVEWLCGLHSLIVIGYTYDKVITSDPYTGQIKYYDKKQFEKMYNTYGKRAIYYE